MWCGWLGETEERTAQQSSFVGGGEYEDCEDTETTGGGLLKQFWRAPMSVGKRGMK